MDANKLKQKREMTRLRVERFRKRRKITKSDIEKSSSSSESDGDNKVIAKDSFINSKSDNISENDLFGEIHSARVSEVCNVFDEESQQVEFEVAASDVVIPDPSVYETYEEYSRIIEIDHVASDNIEDNNPSDGDENIFYSSDLSSEDELNSENEFDEIEKLREWAITSNIPHKNIDELLTILRKRILPELPKSAKTFLKTSSSKYHIAKFDETSEFVYFGLQKYLIKYINPLLHSNSQVELLFNFDGLPLYKSSSKQFWPILCQIYHTSYKYEPFTVAIYVGNTKPSNVDNYLKKFIAEMNDLQKDGLKVNDKIFKISIKSFICDRPARSLIKCVKNHGGYFACEGCEVKGNRIANRTTYCQFNCPLRTHESFINQRNLEHHTGISPLVNLKGIDMINMFSLDFMHLGCLGIMKKLLTEIWLDKQSAFKLNSFHKKNLSHILMKLKSQIPSEFQRSTRDINDIQKYKATEYRLFLLYVGPIALRSCLTDDQYKHYLLLHAGCRILSSNLALECNDHAKLFLSCFVLLSGPLYGAQNYVLNMHSLIHLADDAKYYQASISHFTAFAFENLLGKIKKLLRSGNRPLAQVCRRLHEKFTVDIQEKEPCSDVEILSWKYEDRQKTVMIVKKLRYKGMILSLDIAENTVILENGDILQLIEMKASSERKIEITGTHLKRIKPAFTYPCSSAALGIWRVQRDNKRTTCSINEIKNKMVILAIEIEEREKIYAFPLLHN